MTKLILNDEAAELIREKAMQRGYDDPTAYLLDLVAADSDEDIAAENRRIREDFKQAFKDALQGKGMSREEFQRRLADDE
jgi:ribosome-binding protein aMBF1 (putative translation factor)